MTFFFIQQPLWPNRCIQLRIQYKLCMYTRMCYVVLCRALAIWSTLPISSRMTLLAAGLSWSYSWWRHQMETFSALLAICAWNSPVPGEFPAQRPVARSFDVFFDLHPNKRLSKQSRGWWFETPSCPLWRHHNVLPECQWSHPGEYEKIVHTNPPWIIMIPKQNKAQCNCICLLLRMTKIVTEIPTLYLTS